MSEMTDWTKYSALAMSTNRKILPSHRNVEEHACSRISHHRSIVTLLSVAFTLATQVDSNAEEASFPLVMRIDKSVLQLLNSNVDVRRPIDRVVLGTHAVGESRTRGVIRAALIPDSAEASVEILFEGSTATKTIGVQGPAVIYGHTLSNFICRRSITFDPHQGFVLIGNTTIVGDTRLIYDGFSSNRRLGGRLISRIAERRAGEMHEQARLIADRDSKNEVRESVEKEMEKQVRAANEATELARYVNRFLGDRSKLQIYAKSSSDCIHIGVGPAGEKYDLMTVLPPSRKPSAPIEFWAHTSILNGPVATLLKLAAPQTTLPQPLKTKFLEMLSLASAPSDSSIDVASYDGWLVLSVPQYHPAVKKSDTSSDLVGHEP